MNGPNGRPFERRRLLGVLGAGLLAGGAGCLGGGGGDDENEGEDEPRTVDSTIEHPGDAPVAFTDDQNCPICNMTPADYPNWHGQVAHEDGMGAAFDTPGCLFAYLVITTSDSPVAGAWISDYETGDLIDATEASYVLITDETAVDDIMKINPRSFADRDDAVAFLEEYDAEDLTEEDIIEFDEIDRETAEIYRGNRM